MKISKQARRLLVLITLTSGSVFGFVKSLELMGTTIDAVPLVVFSGLAVVGFGVALIERIWNWED